MYTHLLKCFPGGSDGKASVCNAGDPGLIPGLGTSPGEGNSSPLQYSCLENLMDRGAWWATVHWVTESDMTERLHSLCLLDTNIYVHYMITTHLKFLNLKLIDQIFIQKLIRNISN